MTNLLPPFRWWQLGVAGALCLVSLHLAVENGPAGSSSPSIPIRIPPNVSARGTVLVDVVSAGTSLVSYNPSSDTWSLMIQGRFTMQQMVSGGGTAGQRTFLTLGLVVPKARDRQPLIGLVQSCDPRSKQFIFVGLALTDLATPTPDEVDVPLASPDLMTVYCLR